MRPVTYTACHANEHRDPLHTYGFPCSTVTYADGHEHHVTNTDAFPCTHRDINAEQPRRLHEQPGLRDAT